MLNLINFLVFRVTRTVVFALEVAVAPTPEAKARGGSGLVVWSRGVVGLRSHLFGRCGSQAEALGPMRPVPTAA